MNKQPNKKFQGYRLDADLIEDVEILSKISGLKKTTIVENALRDYIIFCVSRNQK